MRIVPGQWLVVGFLSIHLDLQAGLDSSGPSISISNSFGWDKRVRSTAYMSRGYTIAFASTAPVAPANALPHGGNGGGEAVAAISKRRPWLRKGG